jgi:hypothetical protein
MLVCACVWFLFLFTRGRGQGVILTLHELTLAYNGSGKRRILSVVVVVMVTGIWKILRYSTRDRTRRSASLIRVNLATPFFHEISNFQRENKLIFF